MSDPMPAPSRAAQEIELLDDADRTAALRDLDHLDAASRRLRASLTAGESRETHDANQLASATAGVVRRVAALDAIRRTAQLLTVREDT